MFTAGVWLDIWLFDRAGFVVNVYFVCFGIISPIFIQEVSRCYRRYEDIELNFFACICFHPFSFYYIEVHYLFHLVLDLLFTFDNL